MDEKLEIFLLVMNKKVHEATRGNKVLKAQKREKYWRIVMMAANRLSVRTWAFVNIETGDIYKPRNNYCPYYESARGNITKPETYENFPWNGPWIYKGLEK